MKSNETEWMEIQATVDAVVEGQQQALLRLGRRIVPTLTTEDMLQPNDYPELNAHPEFRYEEGVLHGMQSMQMALRALSKEST